MSRPEVFIYRIGELGDTLVSLPVIQAIRARHPNARCTLITNPSAQAHYVNSWHVLQHTGVFDEVIYLAPRLRLLLPLLSRLRQRRAATFYYLSPPRTRRQQWRDRLVFSGLGGLRHVVGLGGETPLTTLPRNPQDGRLLRLPRESQRLLRLVGLSAADVPPGPQLKPPRETTAKVDARLQPLVGRRLLGVGPGSKMPAKRWFMERFIAVLQRAVETDERLGVVVLGGPEDRPAGEAILDALPAGAAVNVAGDLNIIESAAALARCAAYLGNDTGTMHLAACMEVPCVALFTSRDSPGAWEPWGDGHIVLRRDLPCSGCMLTTCEQQRMRCLALIGSEEVSAALHTLLGSARPGHDRPAAVDRAQAP